MADMEMNVPEGWEHRKLGEVFVSRNDKSKQIKSSDYLESGVYPVVDQSEVFVCGYSNDVTKVISTSLPLVVFGDHTRHTKFVDFPFVCGADGTQLVKPKGEFDNQFFYYLVLNASQLIGNHGYDRHFKHLKNFPTIFPKYAAEQRQIARILSKVDEAIIQTEQLIAKYRRLKTGLMQDLLTKGIDAHGNIRSEETHAFKDSPLGRIPAEWECSIIGDVCYVTKLAGYEYSKHMKYGDDGEIIALRAMNIKNETLILDDVQRIKKSISDFLVRSKIYKGDILITYIGAYIGDIVQIQENDKYHLAPNIAKIVAGKKLTSNFLEHALRSQRVQAFFKSLTTTTANPSLTMGQIRKSFVIFPKELKEQENISIRIETLKNHLETLSNDLAKYQSIKIGLMQDLLSGKVRVEQLIRETADV